MNVAPSLTIPPPNSPDAGPSLLSGVTKKNLTDLLYDGFLMLFLLKKGHEPVNAKEYANSIQKYLMEFERNARNQGIPAQDIHAAKYAFCAAIDETILQSHFAIKNEWYIAPLQLSLFGDQLAGTNFFERLDDLRHEGADRIQALEVFHMCLLLGFQGKYLFDGQEKLGFLTSKLGDEIVRMRSQRTGFAPFWKTPDQIVHRLKRDIPLWIVAMLIGFFGLTAFLGIRYVLDQQTTSSLSNYNHIVNVGPRSAHLTISLP